MLHLTWIHWLGIAISFIAVFISIALATSRKSSLEGFSVAGRTSSAWLVAGSLVGTIVGGSATIGTTQAAVSTGFSAWWFTVGSTLGFLVLGKIYAGPLRRSGLATIAEYMALHYGKAAGVATSLVSVLGIFFSLVSSGLAGIHFMQVLFPVSTITATALLIVVVVVYVLLGGIKGTAVSGIVKTILLYLTLCLGGWLAATQLSTLHVATGSIWSQEWVYPHQWHDYKNFFTNCLSVIIGVVVTQSYAQAIYSARSTAEAVRGSYLAAALCLPVGVPLILIGLFMGATTPNEAAVTALPRFMSMYMPSLLGGLGIGAILLSIIGSIAGLSLGAATSLSVDIVAHGFGVQDQRKILLTLQASLIMITLAAFSVSLYRYQSQLLYWNFLSFSLRGAGLFFPFLLAIFQREFSSMKSITANILCSTLIAVLSIEWEQLPLNPLYVGMITSLLWLGAEYIFVRKGDKV